MNIGRSRNPAGPCGLAICVIALLGSGLMALGQRIPDRAEPLAIAPFARLFPTRLANDVSPDSPLRISFPSPVVLGKSGTLKVIDQATQQVVETIDLGAAPSNPSPPSTRPAVTHLSAGFGAPTKVRTIGGLGNYNYYPIIVSGNEAQIFLPGDTLAYGKRYRVTIDPGVFILGDKAFEGLDGSAWTFATRDRPPAAGSTKLTVAADGSGDFATLQGALDFIPDGNTTPITITLRKGTYTEMVYLANKHGITILGEDRKQTVLEYPTNDRFNNSAAGGGYRRGVFRANRCNDLVLANLTIRNTTPQGGSQAETIILNGTTSAHAILTQLDLYSFQDTLQVNGQAYISDCFIQGDVDFMWGTGPCFFENCTARSVRSNAYYTQIRNPMSNHGYVFYHCTFDGLEGVKGNFLARIEPVRFPYSEVALIDCTLGAAVSPVAWKLDGSTVAPNVHFWEFNSHTAAGESVDTTGRLAVSRQLKEPEDSATIKQYTDPTFVLGNDWNPKRVIAQLKLPATAPATTPKP